MKTFNKLYGISLLSILLSVAACTSETEEQREKPAPEPSGGTARREVLLTLKNKLSIVQTKSGDIQTKASDNPTKAGDVIATADENKISSLDIYVFGSTAEDGDYSYQERFCYREKAADMPVGDDITVLDLTAKDADGKETTALLSLKKGLFVKLYCIANQPELLDAAGNKVTNFVPLQQSNPGQPGNTVTEGTPLETAFLTYHSPLLDPLSTTDILVTPLPMTGAYTTPLDLTDFSVSARLQLGFKLTRAVARFDITNDATKSKFTIRSVSMANGRQGVSFFPLKVYGSQPVNPGDLITYPARKFDGDKANEGLCTGAFYTWPSPVDDGGYLILNGTYAANLTDPVPVTYKVPFKPEGNGNYIEVSQNHRYTVNITNADEYHLDFTISVDDWTDEGNIDDYEPGGDVDADGMKVTINGASGTYDPATRTVTMEITDGAQFQIEGASISGYFVTLYYADGDTENQWLEIDPAPDYMPTKADNDSKTTYTVKRIADYVGNFPVATLRFTDKITAKETIVIVQPIAKPIIKQVSVSSGCTFDEDNQIISFSQGVSTTSLEATFSVLASGGSKLDFNSSETPGAWLTITKSQLNYTLKMNTLASDFPNPFPDDGVEMKIMNMGDETKYETYHLKFKSDFIITQKSISSGSTFEMSNKTITFNKTASVPAPNVTFNVFASGGSKLVFPDGSASDNWLIGDPASKELNVVQGDYKLTVNTSGTGFPDPYSTDGIKMNIVNKNNDKQTEAYTLKMKINNPEIVTALPTAAGSSGSLSYYDAANKKMYLFDDNSSVKLTIFSLGGCKVVNAPSWMSVTTGNDKNTMEITFKQASSTTTEDVSATIKIQNSLDNTRSISLTVYQKLQGLRLQNFSKSNSYTYLENAITSATPSVVYYPTKKDYFEFKVRSPFGITASDNTNWINTPAQTSTQTYANGDVLTTIRVTMYSSITAATCNTRRKTGVITMTATKSAIIKRMNIKTEHMTFNDPNITEPPILVHDYGYYWMSPSKGKVTQGQYNTYKNACPEGWGLISASDITYLFAGKRINHTGGETPINYTNSNDRLDAINIINEYTAVAGGAGYYFYPNDSNSRMMLGVASGGNTITLRCWRAYNSSTDQ